MEAIIKISLVLFMLVIVALFMAFPVMLLWNWLMPKIFGLIVINFWEALGLCLLSSAFFKSSNSSSKN